VWERKNDGRRGLVQRTYSDDGWYEQVGANLSGRGGGFRLNFTGQPTHLPRGPPTISPHVGLVR